MHVCMFTCVSKLIVKMVHFIRSHINLQPIQGYFNIQTPNYKSAF